MRAPLRTAARRRLRRLPLDDRGGITAWVAPLVVPLLFIIGLVLDGGGRLAAAQRADAVAIEAARAGGQAIDAGQAIPGDAVVAEPAAARAAAYAYLDKAGASGKVSVSADGTELTVTVTGSYDTKFLPVMGISSLAYTGKGTAALLHGVTEPEAE